MSTQMHIGRILLLIICAGISFYFAFKQTPELDGVKNAWFYRLCLAMMFMEGLAFIAFDSFGLFPLE